MSEPNSLNLLALFERPIYRRAVILGVLGAAIAMGSSRGIASGFLVLAGAFLLLTLGLLWWSLESLSGKAKLSLDEALSLARPSAEEEQKQSVLRALKDLEFERSVGKISDEDYQELSAHYRAEAKRLMALLDEHHARSRAEVEALARGELGVAKTKAKVDPVDVKIDSKIDAKEVSS